MNNNISVEQLHASVGFKVTSLIRKSVGSLKLKPMTISLHDHKPKHYLNDGDTLFCFALDLNQMTMAPQRLYCGSSDTSYLHPEQFKNAETISPPEGFAYIFVHRYASCNGQNASWDIDIVSKNILKQLN